MPRANPRAACLEALSRWEKTNVFADEILHALLDTTRFSPLDRALLTEMFYGVLRHLRLLDFLIAQLREEKIDTATRQVLRLGLYQIFRMRVPRHAAVNETVQLAGRARPLVNALLRRSIREEQTLRQRIAGAPLDIRLSHPPLLVQRWEKHFGPEATRELCTWNNRPAEMSVRANELKVTRGELARSAEAELLEEHPLMLRVKSLPLAWIMQGLCYVQDPSTLSACELLAPQPGERVLDACAAPGGKTSYLAQLMCNEGAILACDASAHRLARLQHNLRRLGVINTQTRQVDWTRPTSFTEKDFDRILIDAPCTNTGVIRRRVDVRWRLTTADFSQVPLTQLALLRAIVPLLKKSGTLVYSTCSMEPEENENVVQQIVAGFPHLQFLESRQTLPFRDGMDGAFAAKFQHV